MNTEDQRLHFKTVGEYKYFENCRACGSSDLENVIDLGVMPLAGGFIKESVSNMSGEKFYPLELVFCKNCYLLQVNSSINPDTLFKYYFYRSSVIKTLVDHFEAIALKLSKEYRDPQKTFVVEIGSNDGSFIKELQKHKFNALGIDPATNIVQPLIDAGVPILNTYFGKSVAEKIIRERGHADVVFSSNTLAHIEDINDVFLGISHLLKDEGQLFFEVHYLESLLKETQYDMVYHEHQYYYSVLSAGSLLARHGLEIFDAERISMHAGSIRIYAQKKETGKRKKTARLFKIIQEEKRKGYHKAAPYRVLSWQIQKTRKDLLNLLTKLKKSNKKIVGYGASGRGTIISNYCGLEKFLEYVIDDSPAKQGSLMPGNHLRVVPSSILYESGAPDHVILFAWSFVREIKGKHQKFLQHGGRFIAPLPTVSIIAK